MSSMMDGEERGLLAGDGSKQPWGSPRRSYYSQRHVAGLAAGLLVFLLVGAPIIVVPAGHLAIVDFYGALPPASPSFFPLLALPLT